MKKTYQVALRIHHPGDLRALLSKHLAQLHANWAAEPGTYKTVKVRMHI